MANKYFTTTQYFTTPDKVKDTLNTYGVAIIPSILDDNESDAILSGTWDFLEHITQKQVSRSTKRKN